MRILACLLLSLLSVPAADALMPEDPRITPSGMTQAERLLLRREARLHARMVTSETHHPGVQSSVTTQRFRAFFRSGVFASRHRTETVTRKQGTDVHAESEYAMPAVRGVARMRAAVLRLVNEARSQEGLAPLVSEAHLTASAQAYADWMAEDGFFSHADPAGRSSLDRIRDTGYLSPPCDCDWQYAVGENLAKHQATPEAVIAAWMASPEHRANIMYPAFTDVGIGFRDGVWVQHFGGVWER